MGATEEQMQLMDRRSIDHVSYILILYSITFLMFLCKIHNYSLSEAQRLTYMISREHAHPSLRGKQ
jgi:hypothetical protein